MNYKNRLIGMSLIALAAFSSCTDEVENGGRPLSDDHSLSFAVSTGRKNSWTDANATRSSSAPATRESEPIEMQGKVNGQAVYLQTEVTRGFPGDNTPMTRGTQIDKDEQDKIQSFGVSAYTDKDGKPDYMYNEEATKNGDLWFPGEKYYWPGGKKLSFYAWYPYTATGMTLTDNTHAGAPVMTYAIPENVADQIDVMTAKAIDENDPNSTTGGTQLNFNHSLAAVKFAVGSLPNCIVRSITIEGVKHSGKYTLGSDAWDLDKDVKDFILKWDNKEISGTKDTPITADDETLFMMPQQLTSDARIVVELNDGTKDFTVSASIGSNNETWEMGHTYTYYISFNFISLIVSNETFIAYTDAALTNQVAFLLTASANEGVTGTITSQTTGVTVSPATFTNNEFNTKVTVTWPKDVTEATVLVSMTDGDKKKEKEVLLKRETPTTDGPYWVYSVPETTSESLGRDVLDIQNISESDWIAFTTSSTYSDQYSKDVLYNHSGSDIYLQTLSIPSADRLASLLAEKESENVMYCVEQKGITADYGFKNCARNISRESEKWNIVLTGGRFKDTATRVKAKVVIASSVPAAQGGGTSLTYNVKASGYEDINIDKTTGTGKVLYTKKRWDTGQNNANNNGTRVVNVQICPYNNNDAGTWYDVAGTGTMADRLHWILFSYDNKYTCFHKTEYHSGTDRSIYNSIVIPIYTQCYHVHASHPYFGKTKWQVIRDEGNNTNSASYRMWRYECKKDANYSIYGHGAQDWGGMLQIQLWGYSDYASGALLKGPDSNPWCYIYVKGEGATFWRDSKWESWNVNEDYHVATIPVIQNVSARPSDLAPITGTSVDE